MYMKRSAVLALVIGAAIATPAIAESGRGQVYASIENTSFSPTTGGVVYFHDVNLRFNRAFDNWPECLSDPATKYARVFDEGLFRQLDAEKMGNRFAARNPLVLEVVYDCDEWGELIVEGVAIEGYKSAAIIATK